MKEKGTCSLCNEPYEHWGNNPEPLLPYEKRCCDFCNSFFVLPARIGRKMPKLADLPIVAKYLKENVDYE